MTKPSTLYLFRSFSLKYRHFTPISKKNKMSPYSLLLRRAFSSEAVQVLKPEPNKVAKLVEEFRTNTQDPSFRNKASYYLYTVRELKMAKAFDSIEEILDEQKKYVGVTDERFSVRLILLYGKSGLVHRAHQLFDEMPKLNGVRTVKSFNALLAAYISSKKFYKVDGVFRDLPGKLGLKPDVVSYNTLIHGFRRPVSLDLAVSTLEEMMKEGVNPNAVTFNTLIDGCYKHGEFVVGDTLWGMMAKYKVVPNISSYNTKLHRFVLQEKVQEAIELIEEIKKAELKPDTITYNILFKGLCSDGKNLDEAKRWYSSMTEANLEPDIATFTTLLLFACNNNDFEFGELLCRKLFKCKFWVDVKLVQKVIDGLVEKSRVDEAKSLLQLGMDCKHTRYHNLKMPKSEE